MRFDVSCGIGMTKRQVKVQDASTTGNKPIANLIYLSILKYYNNIIIKRQLIEKKVMPIINAKHIFGTSDIRHIISTDCVTTEQIPLFTLKEEAYIIL